LGRRAGRHRDVDFVALGRYPARTRGMRLYGKKHAPGQKQEQREELAMVMMGAGSGTDEVAVSRAGKGRDYISKQNRLSW